jgi:NAD(P)-dependent dehydrogenase (short-subunit alcohol dehydrogenase family)
VSHSASLSGRIALVTGGSRGLGREVALGFAEAGADLVIASRKLDSCEAVADQIRTMGRRAWAYSCHLGRWADCTALVERVYADAGPLDVLVNNAGMSPLYPSLTEVSEELFDKVIGVNLKGPFRLTALVGSRMAAGAGGSIINISSVSAIRPTPRELPYAAAKAGLDALTAGFAQAYAPTVRVNSIMAGPFLTDISAAWSERTKAALSARQPAGRLGRPDEIVAAALYFAADSASYTTGSVLRVDGGSAVAT